MTGKIQLGTANDLVWSDKPMHATTFAAWCQRYAGDENRRHITAQLLGSARTHMDHQQNCVVVDFYLRHSRAGDTLRYFRDTADYTVGDIEYIARVISDHDSGSVAGIPIEELRCKTVSEFIAMLKDSPLLEMFARHYIAATLYTEDRNIGNPIRLNLTRAGFMFLPQLFGYRLLQD